AQVYAPRLAALAKKYEAKGARFVGVASGSALDVAEMKAAAQKASTPYPILKDVDASLAQRLGVETTTAVVVLDANRRARYRGAVDDQYGVAGRKPEPGRRYLVEALEAVLGGRAPEVEATAAPGCPIDLPAAGKAGAKAA